MLYGSKRWYDKNGDGKLSARERRNWYWGTYGEALYWEQRQAQQCENAQKRAAIIANYADRAYENIVWMCDDLIRLEGDREDQAERIVKLALYVISDAIRTQTLSQATRDVLRALWEKFQPALGESIYQAWCVQQVIFEEEGGISKERLGSFWKEILAELPPERRIGKDADLEELLNDTTRLYDRFRDDDTPERDFAEEFEPYWAAIRLPEKAEEPEEYEEDEDYGADGEKEECVKSEAPEDNEKPDEEFEPWADYYEKMSPVKETVDNSSGYYQFCNVQFRENGKTYAYMTGGISLAAGDFVVVPISDRNVEKLARVTDVFVCSTQDAPYPPEKAKFVLRKSERTAFPERAKPQYPAPRQAAAPEPAESKHTVPPVQPAQPQKPVPPVQPPAVLQPVSQNPAEPEKPKRKVAWKWIVTAAAVAAFAIFALPPMIRETQRQMAAIQAEQAVEREAERQRAEQEAQREEQRRLEEEAAAQRRREEEKARIETLKNANLPYPGMPYAELSSTKLGKASKSTSKPHSGRIRYTYIWQIRDGDLLYPVFTATVEDDSVLTAFQQNLDYWNGTTLIGSVYHKPESKPVTPSQSQSGGASGLRDEYDSPEDLYEDNPWDYEDEDEAWDAWEND